MRSLGLLLSLSLSLGWSACIASNTSKLAGDRVDGPSDETATATGMGTSTGQGSIQPGTLTAGAWDDNRNFDFFQTYQADPKRQLPGRLPLTLDEQIAAHDRHAAVPGGRARLDVALVLDTTGSMGDELEYLKVELSAIAGEIRAQYPASDQRWAAVLYRDDGDDYVVRTFDFTSDLASFQADLGAQSAGGGGDTPEKPEAGLATAIQLAWRADPDVARVAFWVGDAPHHVGHEDALAGALRAHAQGDVHLYPVAASGADPLLELTMRQGAQLTGGRYLFLTDDSGVGGSHEVPTVPCFFVTRFDRAMRRMLTIELSGVYAEPDAADVIRTGGDPADGRCQLDGGVVALAY